MFELDLSGEEQRSEGWKLARAGSATGSRFLDAITFLKNGKESAARRSYKLELVCERLTGIPTAHFSTKPMERGSEIEDDARTAYEIFTGNVVEVVNFMPHPTMQWCGVSLDGIVSGKPGTIEIKSPNPLTHLSTLLLRSSTLAQILLGETEQKAVPVPEEHQPQIQGGLWVSGREWCDFISYDPRFPKNLQLYVQRVPRDEKYIANLAAGLTKFLDEVEEAVTLILGVGVEPELLADPVKGPDLFAAITAAKS